MPLFQLSSGKLAMVRLQNFKSEKELQAIVEHNLDTIFNCSFVATEFPTGQRHGGRIDTLALSEDGNPVIIEYKKTESSDLINQSLFYLSWIDDHRGDFEMVVSKAVGKKAEVDWSDVRVICIAPGYKKYDIHAVQMMGASIELWQYRLYDNGALYFDEVFRKADELASDAVAGAGAKNPVMVSAGKKAAITRATGQYSVAEHMNRPDAKIVPVAEKLREFLLGLGEDVEEAPKKFYISYKVAQNFVCMEMQKSKLLLYLKLAPSKFSPLPSLARDVSKVGHYGTGDLELTVTSETDLDVVLPLIRAAYEEVGG